jgi:hypothetical protein
MTAWISIWARGRREAGSLHDDDIGHQSGREAGRDRDATSGGGSGSKPAGGPTVLASGMLRLLPNQPLHVALSRGLSLSPARGEETARTCTASS